MNWLSFFKQSENISPENTKELLASQPPGTLQLLDVRQPKEYEQSHIPGAILIPIGELPDRLDELDSTKETIVYCRSGVRSKAGCQVLSQANFSKVLNMSGGIIRWEGGKASGLESVGLEYFIEGDFSSAVSMAYAMEKGLKTFYLLMAEKTQSTENKELLDYMARLEDGHMAKLNAQYGKLAEPSNKVTDNVAEGGIEIDTFLSKFEDQTLDMSSILQIGMLFESQAYDLYSRLAHKTEESELRSFYLQMAGEEKKHLAQLAKELEQRLM